MTHDVHIIGGGLAGSEAAWQLARRGARVRLSEMRGGGGTTPAHQTDGLAELVCSNSFRSDDDEKNAVGLLHHEMRRLDSLVMRARLLSSTSTRSAAISSIQCDGLCSGISYAALRIAPLTPFGGCAVP